MSWRARERSFNTTKTYETGRISGLDFSGADADIGKWLYRDNPMPLYPFTSIMRVYPRAKSIGAGHDYFTQQVWGNRGTYYVNAGAPDSYVFGTIYPYFNTSERRWEIACGSGDFQGDLVTFDQWYLTALVTWSDGSGKHHKFYYDLDRDTSKVITRDESTSYGNFTVPTPSFMIGHHAFNVNANELYNGIIKGSLLYATNLSLSDILSEATLVGSTTAGRANLWYANTAFTPQDIRDHSGNGHDFSWNDQNNLPGLWLG